ncbi:TolC family outer membrane protein [Pararhizobium haloflavum]|uniref:TolC family outer membrane protein n=1 Tax=Pararhizobium haloflavum TaxID=2037914 RepID=UPI000C1860D6|nr:TolC family outer membrane protein [Pararhizobium haloflavum]
MRRIRAALLAFAVVPLFIAAPGEARAESILGAMSQAYDNNPDLNAARAGLRATDEGVAIAKSGYRPTIGAQLDYTATQTNPDVATDDGVDAALGVSINQTLFDGFQTRNAVLGAQSDVFAGQEQLRDTEQEILLSAVQAFMNVVRDRQIVQIRRQNLDFLNEQLNAAQARFDVGEGTRTDVSQARAQLAASEAGLVAASAQLKSSEAVYFQIVGNAPPSSLTPSSASSQLLPNSLESAITIGLAEHPLVKSSQYAMNAADFAVKEAEGSLLPGVTVSGSFGRDLQTGGTQATVGAQLSVPIYQGGAASARVRQSKELLGQARINVDVARNTLREAIVTSWTQLEASRAAISANRAQLDASNLALSGVIEERDVGQRTTLDVLNAQQDVLNARETLVQSERDSIVASYAVLSTTGRLLVNRLGLQVAEYRPEVHYEAVKDKWYGLRTIDGR